MKNLKVNLFQIFFCLFLHQNCYDLTAQDKNILSNEKNQIDDFNEVDEEEFSSKGSQMDEVLLRVLNKVTAHTQDIVATIDQKLNFKHLEITARLCQKSSPEDSPESIAYLEIYENKPREKSELIFSNWMFASSPAISSLEHPVYDIWVLHCQGQTLHELLPTDFTSSSESANAMVSNSKKSEIEIFNKGFQRIK